MSGSLNPKLAQALGTAQGAQRDALHRLIGNIIVQSCLTYMLRVDSHTAAGWRNVLYIFCPDHDPFNNATQTNRPLWKLCLQSQWLLPASILKIKLGALVPHRLAFLRNRTPCSPENPARATCSVPKLNYEATEMG